MSKEALRVVFLGPPGSGKGTMGKILAEKVTVPHIAVGDLLREAVRAESELGKKAAEFINAGKLVPDELTIGLTREKLSSGECKHGFILDGFPRNLVQAEALEKTLVELNIKLDAVVYFAIPLSLVVDRLTGRRSCKNCGAVYHIKNKPPKKEGVCDACGGELYQRKDDQKEVIENRFKVYDEQTAPLVNFYVNKGKFLEIDASLGIDAVFGRLASVLGIN
ncbi:MAG: adenylate kinase [Candidatus Saganbacteria bacterium]|nr:adenylate kinase [Candidatus Saganbacteria bacterium]